MSRIFKLLKNRFVYNLPKRITEKRITHKCKNSCEAVEIHTIRVRNSHFETKNKFLHSKRKNLLTRYFMWIEEIERNRMTDLNECIGAIYELPECVKGMKTLDKSLFKQICKVPALKVPHQSIGKLKFLKKKFFKIPNFKQIVALDENDPDKQTHKLVLFNPNMISKPEDFTPSERTFLKDQNIDVNNMESWSIELSYENLTASEVIRAILPDEVKDTISGFTIVGHIAHLNLKKEVLDFKYIIGEVILDKNSIIRTVINKLDQIDNTFRNFQLELLAGEEDYQATVKENDCSFRFDFSKVYWNTRLVTEHKRIVDKLKKGDVLYDIFAGVGPFSLPATRKGVTVLANDLNPESCKGLKDSIPLNKINPDLIRTYNLDGRTFIKTIVKEDLIKCLKDPVSDRNLHVVMNLPALALEFLDTFKHLIDGSEIDTSSELVKTCLPMVYCYCFTKDIENAEKDVKERAENSIGLKLPSDSMVRFVRNVAPNKDMMCLTFKLMPEVVFGCSVEEPDSKKQKLSQ